ncbi:MAG: PH domain-containing protein [Erythrobacter sp.]
MDQSLASQGAASLSQPGDETALTRLHPNYIWALRVQMLFTLVPLLIAALVAESVLGEAVREKPDLAFLTMVPQGALSGTVMLIALVMLIFVPQRRYNARGYHMSADRLRVVRGVLWHSDTVVPFGRVQHIDVHQTPVERFFGLATLTLHTAGNHNASVNLPGLGSDRAREMREEIRAHIKRESL